MDAGTARRQLRLSLGLAAIVAAGTTLGVRPGGPSESQIQPTVQAPQVVHVKQAQMNLP